MISRLPNQFIKIKYRRLKFNDAYDILMMRRGDMDSVSYYEHQISSNVTLTIIDMKNIDGNFKKELDDNLTVICEGDRVRQDLQRVKKRVKKLFLNKKKGWIIGATAEFFIHLFVRHMGYKQECLFFNLEENSIKKGFDGYYSKGELEWLMESKAGEVGKKGVSFPNKICLAMNDLSCKVSGKDKNDKDKQHNNAWREAYSHAAHYDVGASEKILKNIKKLSEDYTNEIFHSIEEFNTIPSATIFLSGSWVQPDHEAIKNGIDNIVGKLKGKRIHVICVTQRSIDVFKKYIESEE